MEIQNISGPDAIPQGPAVQNTPPVPEVARTAPEREAERRPEEENKGKNVDQYV
jgi:hypothetical protein